MSKNSKPQVKDFRKKNETPSVTTGGVDPTFCVLRLNNLLTFMRELKIATGKVHPELVHIIDKQAYEAPPEIPKPADADLAFAADPHGFVKDEYRSKVRERIKRIADIERDKSSMYAAIWGNCSAESRERIQQIANWADIENNRDPVELIKRIYATHAVPEDAVAIVALEQAITKYHRLNQNPNESLVDFYRRHLDHIVAIRSGIALVPALAPPGVNTIPPTDAIQAARFVNSLDQSRFAHYKSETYNACKLRGGTFPATLADAFREANAHVVVSTSQAVVQAGTFLTNAKKDNSKKQGKKQGKSGESPGGDHGKGQNREKKTPPKPYPLCNNGYHWREDCPDKHEYEKALQRARDELSRKKTQSDDPAKAFHW